MLPDDPAQVIRAVDHPYLASRKGDDILTASGTTLLGADDKAGVAVIMDAVRFSRGHPEAEDGKIRIVFTPDEEIGRGVDKLDMQRLGADFGYTLDAGERGTLEDETFSADCDDGDLPGISAHPGYAKEKLVNAIKVACVFCRLCVQRVNGRPRLRKGVMVLCTRCGCRGSQRKRWWSVSSGTFLCARLAAYEDYLCGIR